MPGPLTPKYVGRTIAIGGRLRIGQYGRYISIITATPATLTLSIDDEMHQTIVSGTQIDCENDRYDHLEFINTGGAPVTLIALISNTKVSDMRGDALLAAMAASLAAIDIDTTNINNSVTTGNGHLSNILAELQGPNAAGTGVADITPAAATATLFLAGAAGRHGCVIQAMSTNVASIFVGFANTMTNVDKILELQPGQGYTWDDYRGDIYVYSVAGGDVVHGGWW